MKDMNEKKELKIKRTFAYVIYTSLRRIAPKDYPSTGEIKTTISDILPALKEHLSEYLGIIAGAEELNELVMSKSIEKEEIDKRVNAINDKFREYSSQHGKDVIDISLSEEAFKTLQTQFNREGWGKTWLANIDEFAELLEAFKEEGK